MNGNGGNEEEGGAKEKGVIAVGVHPNGS